MIGKERKTEVRGALSRDAFRNEARVCGRWQRRRRPNGLFWTMLALAAMGTAGVRGQGTAFTYQGLVSADNELVTGPSDLKFAIYDSK